MTRLVATVLLALSLTACGGGNDDKADSDPTTSAPVSDAPESSGTPTCSDVWVVGETLPEDYEGCEEGDTLFASVTQDCKDGSVFTSYDDRFYAVLGGPIAANVEGDDPAYSAFYDACLGG